MKPRYGQHVLGAFFGILSAVCFSLMGYCVREARTDFSTGQLIFARALAGVVIFSIICRKDLVSLCKRSALPLWARALFGGMSVACFFINLREVSLGTAIVLTSLSPIFVALFSFALAREQFRPVVLCGVLLAFAGVGILVSPSSVSLTVPCLAIGLFGAVMGAFAYLSLKQATIKYSFSIIVLAFSFGLLAVSMADQSPLFPFKVQGHLLVLSAIVVFSLAAQISLTLSYRFLPSTAAATLSLTEVLWSVLLDVFLLGSHSPPVAYAGMFMVVAGARLTL